MMNCWISGSGRASGSAIRAQKSLSSPSSTRLIASVATLVELVASRSPKLNPPWGKPRTSHVRSTGSSRATSEYALRKIAAQPIRTVVASRAAASGPSGIVRSTGNNGISWASCATSLTQLRAAVKRLLVMIGAGLGMIQFSSQALNRIHSRRGMSIQGVWAKGVAVEGL